MSTHERKIAVRVEVEQLTEAVDLRNRIEALVSEYQKTRGGYDYLVSKPVRSSKSIKDIRRAGFLGEEQ